MSHLSLSQALAEGRLEAFVEQEERRHAELASKEEYEASLATVLKPPQSGDQTSRSPSDDDSSGT